MSVVKESRAVQVLLLLLIAVGIMMTIEAKPAHAEYTPGCLNIAIYDYYSNATWNEINSLAEAQDEQFIYHWNPQWQSSRGYCTRAFAADAQHPIPNNGYQTWVLYLSQYPDLVSGDSECGAWHDRSGYLSDGTPYGWVCDSGTYYGVDNNEWSNSVSHEAVELATNPYLGQGTVAWGSYVGINDYVNFEWEIADPVEESSDGYFINSPVDGRRWLLTNFVIPRWFAPNTGYGAGTSRWLDARGVYYGNGLLDWNKWTQFHQPGGLTVGGDYLYYYYPYWLTNGPSCYAYDGYITEHCDA